MYILVYWHCIGQHSTKLVSTKYNVTSLASLIECKSNNNCCSIKLQLVLNETYDRYIKREKKELSLPGILPASMHTGKIAEHRVLVLFPRLHI